MHDDDTTFFDVDTVKLEEGSDDLGRRAANGREAVESHPSFPPNDAETAASDLISDVLTALFGPAGIHTVGGSYEPRLTASENAEAFLKRALESWYGDTEDYTRPPEPGEYGYEAPADTEYDGWDGGAPDRTTISVELDVSGSGTFGGLKRNVESALERGGLTGIRGVRITGKRPGK